MGKLKVNIGDKVLDIREFPSGTKENWLEQVEWIEFTIVPTPKSFARQTVPAGVNPKVNNGNPVSLSQYIKSSPRKLTKVEKFLKTFTYQ